MGVSEKKIIENDIGVVFRVYAGIDLSSATKVAFAVQKPSGAEVEWVGAVDPANSYYGKYTTVSGDLDLDGEWLLSLEATFADGSFYQGETDTFKVYDQFEDL